jgi:simple sugar transport system substrate-binding protein
MVKRGSLALALVAATAALSACGDSGSSGSAGAAGGSGGKLDVTTVVKIDGISWFDRMRKGVTAEAAKLGGSANLIGPDDASPEKQVKLIQDLIPKKPSAITVVPLSPEALEGVLKQAQSAGIKVVTHEAAAQKSTDADIEPFDNAAYGATMMDSLATCMGGKGEYVTFVGSLTAQTHMEWAASELAQAQKEYPGIKRVSDPIESQEDTGLTYDRAKEILAKHPNIKGILGSAASDVAGIGRAVSEAGLSDKVCVMGTSIPSVAGKYLDDGSVDKIFFWDPADAGAAQVKIADMLVKGESLKAGTDLGIAGYDDLQPIAGSDKAFHGSAWIAVDKNNKDKYDF